MEQELSPLVGLSASPADAKIPRSLLSPPAVPRHEIWTLWEGQSPVDREESVSMEWMASPWSPLLTVLRASLSMYHSDVFQNKLHRAMDIYNNLDKEILQRNELLGKIEKETIQAEEVGGTVCHF